MGACARDIPRYALLMHSTITLSAEAGYNHAGKQFIARIKGRHPKFTFAYEFIGRKEGKRGDLTKAIVDEPGLYIERDVNNKGSITDTFYAVFPFDGKLHKLQITQEQAMGVASVLEAGNTVDWDEVLLEDQRATQAYALTRDPEEMISSDSVLGLEGKHRRADVIAARAALIERLKNGPTESESVSPLASFSTEELRAELARRGVQ